MITTIIKDTLEQVIKKKNNNATFNRSPLSGLSPSFFKNVYFLTRMKFCMANSCGISFQFLLPFRTSGYGHN